MMQAFISQKACFNPLPTNKAGRIACRWRYAVRMAVSIHSRPIKPGELMGNLL